MVVINKITSVNVLSCWLAKQAGKLMSRVIYVDETASREINENFRHMKLRKAGSINELIIQYII